MLACDFFFLHFFQMQTPLRSSHSLACFRFVLHAFSPIPFTLVFAQRVLESEMQVGSLPALQLNVSCFLPLNS